jgi:hypothetical protein
MVGSWLLGLLGLLGLKQGFRGFLVTAGCRLCLLEESPSFLPEHREVTHEILDCVRYTGCASIQSEQLGHWMHMTAYPLREQFGRSQGATAELPQSV